VKNKPPYAIESVDHALVLAQLLQQEGSLRVTDAAERLGVSRSTAHRLLAMLVYRDFAEQTDDRRYRPRCRSRTCTR
jgi:IclR family acetate operon transcriptional repressor